MSKRLSWSDTVILEHAKTITGIDYEEIEDSEEEMDKVRKEAERAKAEVVDLSYKVYQMQKEIDRLKEENRLLKDNSENYKAWQSDFDDELALVSDIVKNLRVKNSTVV